MRRLFILFLLLLSLLGLAACGKGEVKIVHCDGCGREITVSADSNVDEDWILLCEDCQKQLESEPEIR